jgi:hypothetical protein
VNVQVARVAWYRFSATIKRRWGGYLSIVVLIGLTGGLAMGSLAAARRTQSSYQTFLASTNPSDLGITLQAPDITAAFARLGDVRAVASSVYLNAFPLERSGAPELLSVFDNDVTQEGSVNGEYFDQDRVTVTSGRMADPARPDQFVASALAAQLLGWHVGEIIPFGFYTNAQSEQQSFGSASMHPFLHFSERLTGIVQFNTALVTDETNRYPAPLLFTPALTKPLTAGPQFAEYDLALRSPSDVSTVEREIIQVLPKTSYSFHVTSVAEGQVDRTVRPLSFALGAFGLIALLVALMVSTLVIARHLESGSLESRVLRDLGAGRAAVLGDQLLGIESAVVLGSVLALAVALALSPLSPLGPVRPVYPTPGVAIDGLVFGAGFAVLVILLGAISLLLALRSSATRHHEREWRGTTARLGVVETLGRTGAPVSVVTGVRFALDSGRGRTSVPARSTILGTAIAVAIVVAALTFGNGLDSLVSHPALYGWNWDYALTSSQDVPPQLLGMITRDPSVEAATGVGFADAQLNKQTVPLITIGTPAAVAPPLISGHEVEANDQIVLGGATLRALGDHLGSTVVLSYGAPKDAPVYLPPTDLTVVGIATLPAIGCPTCFSPSMGLGGVVSDGVASPVERALESPYQTLNGPKMILVRLKPEANRSVALASLRRIAASALPLFAAVPDGAGGGDSVAVIGVQYPAEIQNYRTLGATPAVLAGGLALGAVLGLGLTLVASVRRRRHDLALLKTLGFTGRQLASAVAWQATVVVILGLLVGVPVGIALGRWLWLLFASEIFVVPKAAVPVLSLVYVGVGALLLANAIAALPGRLAARTRTALVLRAE